MFNMIILKTCHASLRAEGFEFLTAVDNVMRWGTGDFLKNIVERLGIVAKLAKSTGWARQEGTKPKP